MEKARTNKYGKFRLEGRYTYSASPAFSQSEVWVKITADQVIVLDKDYKVITSHDRLYGNQKESMSWQPYLSSMSRRPNALKYIGLYKKLPDPLKEFFDQCKLTDKSKALKILLKIIKEADMETAIKTFVKTLENGVDDLDSVLTTYYRLTNKIPEFEDIKLSDDIPKLASYRTDISAYDYLLWKGGV
ncbi:hypothetical protein BBF96_12860 [Anoxybacter fermentans]|uniref:Transposase for insertion sequence element IS21-like C-terminal domain-containing protein n=1 Tax=Anoxybacter fermentans TaxID=1323375 RepID=A0A3Q9HRT0_9FIRM|nr:hypothetical protein [Anoxybacter fermentans]AZR74210.1 hypothetical protein BBF96_12860 [Anoxybacter fermentans]